MKSPYFFFVQRNVLPVPSTVLPTIAPSSTRYSAVPLRCSQPSSVLPSKSATKPSSAAWAWKIEVAAQTTAERRRKREDFIRVKPKALRRLAERRAEKQDAIAFTGPTLDKVEDART